MYTLLESKKEIAAAQKTLEKTIQASFRSQIKRNITTPGGTRSGVTLYSRDGFWFYSTNTETRSIKSRLNWFGVHTDSPTVQIAVQVNVPLEGREDIVAGFFARHIESGRIYLFHSGRVGGGAKGVGKEAFLAWISRLPEAVLDAAGEVR